MQRAKADKEFPILDQPPMGDVDFPKGGVNDGKDGRQDRR